MDPQHGLKSTRGPRAFVVVTVAVILGRLLVWPAVNMLAAMPAWSAAETLVLTGSGASVSGAALAMNNGRAAAVWIENGTTARAGVRPSGGPFGSSQTLSTHTTALEPSISVGSDGHVIAVWAATDNPGPSRTVAVSEVTAGGRTFGSKTTIFTSGDSQTPGATNVAIAANGSALIVFAGDGTFNPYMHIWSAERAAASGAFSVNSRTGNFEVGGTRLAAGSDGAAFALAWGISQGINHLITGAYRSSGGSWTTPSSSPYCCGTLNVEGPTSLVADGSDNAYFTVDVCCNGGDPGPNFIRIGSNGVVSQGATNPDTSSFSASAPSSNPHVVVDSAGNAVMAWVRPSGDLYAVYRAAGASNAFDTPQLVESALGSAGNGRYAIAMDSAGNAIIAFKDSCSAGACTLKSRMRLAGAGNTFATAVTVASSVNDDGVLAIAADSVNNVGILWRDATSPVNLKASFVNTGLADHIAITSSNANLASGSGRTLTAEVRNLNNTAVTSDNSTAVTFAQTAGSGSLTGLGQATASSGVASKAVTGNVAGSVTLTASATGLPSDTTTFTVVVGASHQLTITSATSTLTSGTARTLTAVVQDANGNTITSDNSTVVTFAQTAGSGSLTGLGQATASSGVASKVVTGNVAGPVTITASATGLTSGTTTFTVVVGASHQLTITSATSTLTSGTARTLTAVVQDANGNTITSDNSTVVTFAQTAGSGSLTGLGQATASSGVASKAVTGNVAGSVTITASATGLTSGTSTFTVVAGAATSLNFTSSTAALTSGAARTLTAEIRDANGNVVTSNNSTVVTFAQSSGSGSVTGTGTATASSGIASLSVTGYLAGSVTITASASGLTSSTSTFTVATGAASRVVITSTTDNLAPGHGRALTAELRDANGNVETGDNSTSVTFTQTAGPGSVTGLGSATAASGVATRTVTGGAVGSVTITATASGVTSGSNTFTVSAGPTFTDPTLTPQTTPIKVVHVTELRDAIATLRARYNLSVFAWTDPSLSAGTTAIKAVHITELRTALQAVYAAAGSTPPSYTDPGLTGGSITIKAVHFTEIRAAIVAIY